MALEQYSAALESLLPQLPAAEHTARRRYMQRFLDRGFPSRRVEEWHYTDLAPLAQREFVNATAVPTSTHSWLLPRTDRLVFVNGELDSAGSTADELCATLSTPREADDSLIALNAALARPGLGFELGADARIARVLHVLIVSAPQAQAPMAHQRHCIALGENAEATVIVEFAGAGDGDRFATHSIDVELGRGAQLRLYRVQNENRGSSLLTRIDARLARDAQLHAVCVDRGHGLCRHDFNAELQEPGAEISLSGLYTPASGAHIDNHTRIVHGAPHCRSREYFKGIVDERTRAVFNGKVVVQAGAQKTDSEQRVANLLLSKRAEVNAKPELEIYADDVKCAHGASVGQLDEKALAYLRMRGIDAQAARALLLHAFANDILERVEVAALRARLHQTLELPADEFTDTEFA